MGAAENQFSSPLGQARGESVPRLQVILMPAVASLMVP